MIFGAALGAVVLHVPSRAGASGTGIAAFALSLLIGTGPIVAQQTGLTAQIFTALAAGAGTALPLSVMLRSLRPGPLTRHAFEEAVIRFLTGFGYVFFTAIVAIPFYVMVMTSLKNQQQLVANPLDFSIDLSQGLSLFRSYAELFNDFNFGT